MRLKFGTKYMEKSIIYSITVNRPVNVSINTCLLHSEQELRSHYPDVPCNLQPRNRTDNTPNYNLEFHTKRF